MRLKKFISSIVLFTILSNNITYAIPTETTVANINVTQSIASDIVTNQIVDVKDLEELKQHDDSERTINITSDILLDENIYNVESQVESNAGDNGITDTNNTYAECKRRLLKVL